MEAEATRWTRQPGHLRLAEVEVDLSSLQDTLITPDWIGAEITHDDRYSAGALAFGHDDEIQALLATEASAVVPSRPVGRFPHDDDSRQVAVKSLPPSV